MGDEIQERNIYTRRSVLGWIMTQLLLSRLQAAIVLLVRMLIWGQVNS